MNQTQPVLSSQPQPKKVSVLLQPTSHSLFPLKDSLSNPSPIFQTACEMTSQWCVVAGPVSAKKNMYTTDTSKVCYIALYDL